MNKPATLTPKAPLLMLVAALALSTSFYAGAAPAFSITPSSKLSKRKKKKLCGHSKASVRRSPERGQ
jgi:hypothetical protein